MQKKKYEKPLSIILAIAIIMSLAGIPPISASNESHFTYTVSGGEATITGYTGPGGDVVIPGSLGGYPVIIIGNSAFRDKTNISSVLISDSVTSIGDSAFGGCSSLTSVIIGNSVTRIEFNAFGYCSSLVSVTIGNSVISIGDNSFVGCVSLENVEFGDSLNTIGRYAFSGCSNLKFVNLPDSLQKILAGAFSGTSIESIIIPRNVDTLSSYTRWMPASYFNAFQGSTKLKFITVDPDNLRFTSVDGVVFNKNKSSLIIYPMGRNETNYDIPLGTKSIYRRAFSSNSYIQTIGMPETLTEILDNAFSYCIKLNSLIFPDSLTSIGSAAFAYCRSLNIVSFGSNLVYIDSGAFSNCSSLQSVIIPDSVTSIYGGAFRDCINLEEVIFGASIEAINGSAFSGCEGLKSVLFTGDAPVLGPYSWNSHTVFPNKSDFIIYYLEGAEGFTRPTWYGYNTRIYGSEEDDFLMALPIKYIGWDYPQNDKKKPPFPVGTDEDYGNLLLYWAEIMGFKDDLIQYDVNELLSLSIRMPLMDENGTIVRISENELTVREALQHLVFIQKFKSDYLSPLNERLNNATSLGEITTGKTAEELKIYFERYMEYYSTKNTTSQMIPTTSLALIMSHDALVNVLPGESGKIAKFALNLADFAVKDNLSNPVRAYLTETDKNNLNEMEGIIANITDNAGEVLVAVYNYNPGYINIEFPGEEISDLVSVVIHATADSLLYVLSESDSQYASTMKRMYEVYSAYERIYKVLKIIKSPLAPVLIPTYMGLAYANIAKDAIKFFNDEASDWYFLTNYWMKMYQPNIYGPLFNTSDYKPADYFAYMSNGGLEYDGDNYMTKVLYSVLEDKIWRGYTGNLPSSHDCFNLSRISDTLVSINQFKTYELQMNLIKTVGAIASEKMHAYSIKDVVIKQFPNKIQYEQGQTIDLSGGILEVIYTDNTVMEIPMSLEMITGFNSEILGGKNILVTYGMRTNVMAVNVKETTPRYIVTFKDHDGTILKTELVIHGSAAYAPTNPTREGYNFTGWDKPYESVTQDMDVYAKWEAIVQISHITWKSKPEQTTYLIGRTVHMLGEELDLAGGVITIHYDDGTTEDMLLTDQAITITGYDKNSQTTGAQTQTVSVRYLNLDQMLEFDVRVLMLGDVNNDGSINSTDALSVLRHEAQMISLNAEQKMAADVNRDGKIDSSDALGIQRYEAQLINGFH